MTCQVILEFKAKPGAIEKAKAWLRSVLPDTRGFEGCLTLYCIQDQDEPDAILIIEQWAKRENYEKYLAWRGERGDMETFGSFMAGPPKIRFFDYFGI